MSRCGPTGLGVSRTDRLIGYMRLPRRRAYVAHCARSVEDKGKSAPNNAAVCTEREAAICGAPLLFDPVNRGAAVRPPVHLLGRFAVCLLCCGAQLVFFAGALAFDTAIA